MYFFIFCYNEGEKEAHWGNGYEMVCDRQDADAAGPRAGEQRGGGAAERGRAAHETALPGPEAVLHHTPSARDAHVCKAEVRSNRLSGTLALPRRRDGTRLCCGYLVTKDRVVLVDDGEMAEPYLKHIVKEKRLIENSVGRFLYDFFELLIARDLHRLEEIEDRATALEERVLAGELRIQHPDERAAQGDDGLIGSITRTSISSTSNCYHEHFALDDNGKAPAIFNGDYEEGVRWKRMLHTTKETDLIETTSAMYRAGSLFDTWNRNSENVVSNSSQDRPRKYWPSSPS